MAQGRTHLIVEILKLERKIAPDKLKIDENKDLLREEIEQTGEGFTETIEGLGTVDGKVGCEQEVKGFEYVLNQAAFAALSETRRKKMIEVEELVNARQLVRQARRPSVTVRL